MKKFKMFMRSNTMNVSNIVPVTRQKSNHINTNILNKRRIDDIIYFISDDIKQYQQLIKILGPHHKNVELLHEKILDKLAENNYEIIQFILNKKKRTNEELIIIKTLLSTMKSLSLMINITEPEKILFSLSTCLKLESKPKDSILFRFGDKGTKFYILLSGRVSILILKETRVEMSFKRYFLHLFLLKMMKEKEMVKKTIMANTKIKNPLDAKTFDIIFDKILKFVRKHFGKNLKKKENDLEEDSLDDSEGVSEIENKKNFESPVKKRRIQLNYMNNDNQNNYKFEVKDRIRVEEIKPIKNKFRKRMSIGLPSTSRISILEAAKLKSLTKNEFEELDCPIFSKEEEIKELVSYYLYLKTILANIRKDKISLKDYINNTYINSIFRKDLNEDDDVEEEQYVIYTYHEIVQKNKGDTFGELALQHEDSKRTATILATTDIILGYLTKNDYEACINEIQLKRRKHEVNFIMSFSIFDKMNWVTFEKRYFNFFKREFYSQGEVVLKQGEKINKLIFIMNGQFEITSSLSLNSLYKIIRQKTNYSYQKMNISSNSKKNSLRLSISNNKDIIGLNDCSFLGIFNEEISFITATCISNKSYTFTLDKTILENFKNKLVEIKQNIKQLNKKREKVMVDRLTTIFEQLVKNKKIKKMVKESIISNQNKNSSVENNNNSAMNNYIKSKQLSDNNKRNEEILPQYRNFLLSARFRRSRALTKFNENKLNINFLLENNFSKEYLATERNAFSSKKYREKDLKFEENKNSVYKLIDTEYNIDSLKYKKKITNIMAVKENMPPKLNPRIYLKSAVTIRELNEKTNIREKMKNLYLPLNNIINKEYINLFNWVDYNKKMFDNYKKIKDDGQIIKIETINNFKEEFRKTNTERNRTYNLNIDSKKKETKIERLKEKEKEKDKNSEFGDSKKLSFSSDNEENKNEKNEIENQKLYNSRYEGSHKNIGNNIFSSKRNINLKVRRTLKSLELEEEIKNMILKNIKNKNKENNFKNKNPFEDSIEKKNSSSGKYINTEFIRSPYNKMSLFKTPFNSTKSKKNLKSKAKLNESYLKQILGTRYRNREDEFISRTEKKIVKEINDYNADLKRKKEIKLKFSKKAKENKNKNKKKINSSRYMNGDFENENDKDLLMSHNFNIRNLKKSYEKKK